MNNILYCFRESILSINKNKSAQNYEQFIKLYFIYNLECKHIYLNSSILSINDEDPKYSASFKYNQEKKYISYNLFNINCEISGNEYTSNNLILSGIFFLDINILIESDRKNRCIYKINECEQSFKLIDKVSKTKCSECIERFGGTIRDIIGVNIYNDILGHKKFSCVWEEYAITNTLLSFHNIIELKPIKEIIQ